MPLFRPAEGSATACAVRIIAFVVLAGLAGAGLPTATALANDAEIISIVGRGDSRETPEAEWRAALVRQKLPAGAFVRTHELSQMALLLRDNTQVRLNQLSI